MKKRQLVLTLGLFITGIIVFLSSCKKINEATELGGDLVPPVDNINTFDTILDVQAFNGLFEYGGSDPLLQDSASSGYDDEQFLGHINSDPLFGKTDATMYFELRPPTSSFPFTFRARPDSLYMDSVVLILNYVETYGDGAVAQNVNVYEMASELKDTLFSVRSDPFNGMVGSLLGTKNVIPKSLADSVKAFQDTTSHQLRIALDTANPIVKKFLKMDTTANGGYRNDSLFTANFKGFALKTVSGGNAIMGFDLNGANTKLAIYYRYAHGLGLSDLDTTVQYIKFSTATSAQANYIKRDYSGSPILAAQGGATPDPFVYIQNSPGSFATLKIPGLATLSNRVVHRAELIAEQVYQDMDTTFYPPDGMLLDAYDPSISKYILIPYDFVFDQTGTPNYGNFGVYPVTATDAAGKSIKTWHFNITRYVQHVANGTIPAYDMRILAPAADFPEQFKPPVTGSTPIVAGVSDVTSAFAKGRVRLAGGTPGAQRMRLRIVYSKL